MPSQSSLHRCLGAAVSKPSRPSVPYEIPSHGGPTLGDLVEKMMTAQASGPPPEDAGVPADREGGAGSCPSGRTEEPKAEVEMGHQVQDKRKSASCRAEEPAGAPVGEGLHERTEASGIAPRMELTSVNTAASIANCPEMGGSGGSMGALEKPDAGVSERTVDAGVSPAGLAATGAQGSRAVVRDEVEEEPEKVAEELGEKKKRRSKRRTHTRTCGADVGSYGAVPLATMHIGLEQEEPTLQDIHKYLHDIRARIDRRQAASRAEGDRVDAGSSLSRQPTVQEVLEADIRTWSAGKIESLLSELDEGLQDEEFEEHAEGFEEFGEDVEKHEEEREEHDEVAKEQDKEIEEHAEGFEEFFEEVEQHKAEGEEHDEGSEEKDEGAEEQEEETEEHSEEVTVEEAEELDEELEEHSEEVEKEHEEESKKHEEAKDHMEEIDEERESDEEKAREREEDIEQHQAELKMHEDEREGCSSRSAGQTDGCRQQHARGLWHELQPAHLRAEG